MEESEDLKNGSPLGGSGTKRRRITKACDRCHRGGIKCSPGSNPSACLPCQNYGATCTFDRPTRRRGPPAKTREPFSVDTQALPRELRGGRPPLFGAVKDEPMEPSDEWRYTEIASNEVIDALLEAYRRICYPIYPYFHWPTFKLQTQQGLYRTDRAFCATVMAACAISSARIRDGAFDQLPNPPPLPRETAVSHTEAFYEAAIRAIPADLSVAYSFNYKRAKALLCAVAIQYGYARTFCAHLGDYITMCGIDGFHNEARWPGNLTEIDIQERRRLFWQMYQMDTYAAVTWNGIIRHRESQSTVLYPAEVNDEEITSTGITPRNTGRPPWLKGWNFVVDLYRILEHAAERLRARRTVSPHEPSGPVSILFERERGPTTAEVMALVSQMHAALPQDFKGGKAMTGDMDEDNYGFQAANIIVTLQTVKMVMAGTEQASVSQRCMIAGELLDGLGSVPTAYIHASSTPMMHHLAGVGHLLGSVIQSPLSQWTYLQVRNVLLAMVDLLASLEACSSAEGGSTRLKAHIQRIDAYMTNAAREKQGSKVYHNALPKEAWSNEQNQSLRTTYGTASGVQNGQDRSAASGATARQDRVPIDPSLGTNEPINLASFTQLPITSGSGSAPNSGSSNPMMNNTSINTNAANGNGNGNPSQTLQWAPTDDISPNQQFQLPESFFRDWPFDVGQGEAFDFLAELQNQSTAYNTGNELGDGNDGRSRDGHGGQHRPSQERGQRQGQGGTVTGGGGGGGIQDILGVGFPEGFVGAGQIGGVLGSMGGFSNHNQDGNDAAAGS